MAPSVCGRLLPTKLRNEGARQQANLRRAQSEIHHHHSKTLPRRPQRLDGETDVQFAVRRGKHIKLRHRYYNKGSRLRQRLDTYRDRVHQLILGGAIHPPPPPDSSEWRTEVEHSGRYGVSTTTLTNLVDTEDAQGWLLSALPSVLSILHAAMVDEPALRLQLEFMVLLADPDKPEMASKEWYLPLSQYSLDRYDVDKITHIFNACVQQWMARIDELRPEDGKSGLALDRVGLLKVRTTRYTTPSHNRVRAMGVLNQVAVPGGSFIEKPDWVTQGVVNIQNADDKCLVWAVERALLHGEWRRDRETRRWVQAPLADESMKNLELHATWLRREKKDKLQADWCRASLAFPFLPQRSTLEQLQKDLDVTLHVWTVVHKPRGYEKLFSPSYSAMDRQDRPTVRLLYITEDLEGVGVRGHFMSIIDINNMLSRDHGGPPCTNGKGRHYCDWCACGFETRESLDTHHAMKLCRTTNIDAVHRPLVVLPKKGSLAAYDRFTGYRKQQLAPYQVVCDWEAINVRSADGIVRQVAASFSTSTFCSFDPTFNHTEVEIPTSDSARPNIHKAFLRSARKIARKIREHRLAHHHPDVAKIDWHAGEREQHEAAMQCMYCRLPFDSNSAHLGTVLQKKKKKLASAESTTPSWSKVADHDHATNRYRGAACSHCNLQVQDGVYYDEEREEYRINRAKFPIVFVFHNFKNYDAHLTVQAIADEVPPDQVVTFDLEELCESEDDESDATLEKRLQTIQLKRVITAIPQSSDKFMSVTWKSEGISFIDSMSFIMSSLSGAVDSMMGYKVRDKHDTPQQTAKRELHNEGMLKVWVDKIVSGEAGHFEYLRNQLSALGQHFRVQLTPEHIATCLRKGVWWYSWFTSIDQLDQTELPCAEDGADRLNNIDRISEADMDYARVVWRLWNMRSMRDFLYFYSWLDTVLLSCVFLARRVATFSQNGLDCLQYVSLPSVAYDDYRKSGHTRTFQDPKDPQKVWNVPFYIELLVSDADKDEPDDDEPAGRPSEVDKEANGRKGNGIDMYNFALNLKRGGVSTVKERFAETIDGLQEIVYTDATSLYPTAMHQAMPIGEYEWNHEFTADNIVEKLTAWDPDGEVGYAGQVDIHIPAEHHDYYREFPLFPENRTVNILEVSLEQLRQLAEHGRTRMEPGTELPKNICACSVYEAESLPIVERCTDWASFLLACEDERPVLSPFGCNGVWEFITAKCVIGTTSVEARNHRYHRLRGNLLQQALVRREFLSSHGAGLDEKNQRLMLTLSDKCRYFSHFKYLRWALLHRPGSIVVTRVHAVLQFQQSTHMKEYVSSYMKLRAAIKKANPVLADTLKLLLNSLYGKQLQDDRKFKNVHFVHDPADLASLAGREEYVSSRRLGQYHIVECAKRRVTIRKPIMAGATVMELSKLVMVRAWYEHFKPSFPGESHDGTRRLRLLMTDTDSLVFLVKAPAGSERGGPWQWEAELKERGHGEIMDFSNYPDNHVHRDDSRKGQHGCMKNEGEGHRIRIFVGFGAKFYCLLFDDAIQELKAKGLRLKQPIADEDVEGDNTAEQLVKDAALFVDKQGKPLFEPEERGDSRRKMLRVQNYIRTLRDRTYLPPRLRQVRIGSTGQQVIRLFEMQKRTINVADLKNYALRPVDSKEHSTETVPYGYRGSDVRTRAGGMLSERVRGDEVSCAGKVSYVCS